MLIIRRSNCIIQHLVSSHSVGGRPVRNLPTGRPPTESIAKFVFVRRAIPVIGQSAVHSAR